MAGSNKSILNAVVVFNVVAWLVNGWIWNISFNITQSESTGKNIRRLSECCLCSSNGGIVETTENMK